MIKLALAKLLTLKVAAAATVAVAATGGVAMAASSGALPNPFNGEAPKAQPSASHASGTPSAHAGKGTPSPSMVGLCKAFQARVGEDVGKALESAAFTELVNAAGDKEKVTAYCHQVMAMHQGDRPSPGAGQSNRPDTVPTQAGQHGGQQGGQQGGQPTGEPTAVPTARPSAPAERPTTPPTGGNAG